MPPMIINSILSVGCPIALNALSLALTCLDGLYSHSLARITAGDCGV